GGVTVALVTSRHRPTPSSSVVPDLCSPAADVGVETALLGAANLTPGAPRGHTRGQRWTHVGLLAAILLLGCSVTGRISLLPTVDTTGDVGVETRRAGRPAAPPERSSDLFRGRRVLV